MKGIFGIRAVTGEGLAMHGARLTDSFMCGLSDTYLKDDIALGTGLDSPPIYNKVEDLIIIYTGRLYNIQELRNSMVKKGRAFSTAPDAEILAAIYAEHGTDFLKYIRGMFSLAVWDKRREKLLIARDRFGMRPLYYHKNKSFFTFSSSLKTLLSLPFISKELDMQALGLYFSLEYIPSPHSIFKDVHKLEPGHYIICENNKITKSCYWSRDTIKTDDSISFNDAETRFSQLLGESINEHIAHNGPLGIFLSGGMDSSTLTAISTEYSRKKIPTFSMGFGEKSFDDTGYALFVSKYFNTDHHSYTFNIDTFLNNFHDVTDFLDEPFADLSIFPTYALSKSARKYAGVILSGESGDELFMGYPTYIAHKYMGLFNRFPGFLKDTGKAFIGLLPVSHRYLSLDFKLKQFIKGADINGVFLRHILWMGAFSDDEKALLFTEAVDKCNLMHYNIMYQLAARIKNLDFKSESKIIQYLDIVNLCDNVVSKSEMAGALSSVEIRMPFLDHRLVEFLLSLKPEFLYQKKLLKKTMTGTLPRKILTRSKRGFPMPFAIWLHDKRVLKKIEPFFDKVFLKGQGLFNHEYVSSLLKEHLNGKRENRKKLRAYIMFQAWFKNRFE